ncbi:Fe-S cluster assembly scaffold SufA [Aestuariivirga sp.]|uniref:Fe-S cluster assembly scaffold SufA n=1 Tax=Aestuariivirga sp. TaxID=2650926 RepID=UPI0039E5AE84
MATVRPLPKAMTLTDAAAARVREIMAKSEKPVLGLRIGIKKGGCAGMEYTMDWASKAEPFDERIDDKGATVFINSKAVLFLLGTEMDYQTSTLKSGFVFNNPNQTSACGCGESVQLQAAQPAI